MKKILVVLVLFVLVVGSSIPSAAIILGTGNDTFSYGFSDDYDDGLTFSLLAGYGDTLEKDFQYQFGVEYLAYTLRPSTFINSEGLMEYNEGRIDELRVLAGLQKDFSIDKAIASMSLKIGASFYGNLGGEFLQNALHKTLSLKEVHLPYTYSKPDFCFLMETSIKGAERVAPFASTWVGNEGFFKMGAKVGLQSGKDKCKFSAFIGTEASLNLKTKALANSSNQAIGITSGFNLDTGLLLIDYKRFHETNTGYGHICLRLPAEKSYEETDATFSFGGMMIGNKRINTLVARKSLGENISVVFMDNFFSEVYQRSSVQGLASLTSIEVGFRAGDTFYAQTTLGVGRTYTEDHEANYRVQNPSIGKSYYFTSTLEVGYALETPIVLGSSKLGVELFAGLHHIGDTRISDSHVEFDKYNLTEVTVIYGARLNIGLDF